jgi:hypothetical protein
LKASSAASAMLKPSSLWPEAISLRLSTEPPVTSAVACTLGRLVDSTLATAPPSG